MSRRTKVRIWRWEAWTWGIYRGRPFDRLRWAVNVGPWQLRIEKNWRRP